jgi:hypothetical protein
MELYTPVLLRIKASRQEGREAKREEGGKEGGREGRSTWRTSSLLGARMMA